MLLPRILLCLGVVAGTLSIWDTLSHTWDPSYQAPALALGPTHTNYHAFREFMLSVGAVLVELYGVFQPAAKRTSPLWVAMCLTAVFYYRGWWLPWPIFGYHAPNELSQIDHFIATVITLIGVFCARQQFPKIPTP